MHMHVYMHVSFVVEDGASISLTSIIIENFQSMHVCMCVGGVYGILLTSRKLSILHSQLDY